MGPSNRKKALEGVKNSCSIAQSRQGWKKSDEKTTKEEEEKNKSTWSSCQPSQKVTHAVSAARSNALKKTRRDSGPLEKWHKQGKMRTGERREEMPERMDALCPAVCKQSKRTLCKAFL